AAAIFRCVCVDTLAITARPRHPDAVAFARHWRKVADNDAKLVEVAAAADVGNDTLGRVRRVDPLKAFGFAVELVQCRGIAIEKIEVAHEPPNPLVHRIGKEMHIEPDIVVPLALLYEFATHTKEYLHCMDPHIP